MGLIFDFSSKNSVADLPKLEYLNSVLPSPPLMEGGPEGFGLREVG